MIAPLALTFILAPIVSAYGAGIFIAAFWNYANLFAYFWLIIALTGPQYLPLVRKAFHLA